MPRTAPNGSPYVTLAGIVLIIIAIGLFAIAVVFDRYERNQRDGALTTTGTVVMSFPRGPLIRFTTARGDHLDFTADGRWRRFKPGQTVRIFYHPDNPSFAGLDDAIARWRGEAMVGIAGLLIGLLGISFVRYRPKPS